MRVSRSERYVPRSFIFLEIISHMTHNMHTEIWHDIKKNMKGDVPVEIEDVCILAGGSGGRKELSVLSDLEFFLVSPNQSFDRLVTKRFVKKMSKRGIFVDKLNLPTRRKKTIASSPEELVLGILGGRRLDEVKTSILLDIDFLAGSRASFLKVKSLVRSILDENLNSSHAFGSNRRARTFMKSKTIVNVEKPVRVSHFLQFQMESWKLSRAQTNINNLNALIHLRRHRFNIKTNLYRGIQTSVALLREYAVSDKRAAKHCGETLRILRGLGFSKDMESLIEEALKTTVRMRILAHRFYNAERDDVTMSTVSSREKLFLIPADWKSSVLHAMRVSASLQQAWLILSKNRSFVNDRGDFKLTFQSVFRSVLRIWLPLHDRSAGLSMCSPASYHNSNKRNSPKLLSKVRSAMAMTMFNNMMDS